MNFKNLAIFYALICFTLAFLWMFFPQVLLSFWGVKYSNLVDLIGRRGAALFLGTGVILFSARNAAPSVARSAIVYGFATACLALTVLGLFDFFMGHVGWGIMPITVGEFIMAGALLWVNRAELASAGSKP